MKNAIPTLAIFFVVLILTACSSDKKADNQGVATTTENVESGQKNGKDVARSESTGHQLIENIVTKLHAKLELTDQQSIDLENILIKVLQESGKNPEAVYSVDESKAILKELRVKSHDPVLLILNEDQKVRFEKFMSK